MGVKKQTFYTKEYKDEVLALIFDKGRAVSSVAKDLGLSEGTLYGWVKQRKEHGKEAFVGSGNLRPDDAEIRGLKREIADLREENAILKKATAIFSRELK